MGNLDSRAAFKASVDARDSASVLRVLAALKAARSMIVREDKGLFLQCAGGTIPKDIEALLDEWGYRAIANIVATNTVCFARAKQVERSAPVDRDATTAASFTETLQQRAADLLRRSTRLRQVRNLALDIRGLRPKSLRPRKLNKLLTSPEKFLEDSSHGLLSGSGLRAFKALAPEDQPKKITAFDVPERTLLVCLGPESELVTDAIAAYSTGLTLQTELVVLLSPEHAAGASSVLAAMGCPRARLYVLPDGGAGEMIRYGLARSYGAIVAIVADRMACTSGQLDRAFSQVADARDHFYDSSLHIALARREVWRDHFEGEREDPELRAGIQELLRAIGTLSTDSPVPEARIEKASEYARYPGIDPYQPFEEHTKLDTTVTCFDRKPEWSLKAPATWQSQEPLISVVMTAYNAGDSVGAAIDSIVQQTYANIELIIVDDCSTDETPQILEARAGGDKRIRLLKTVRNSGTYPAKNVGLLFARGVFVSFHDSDDVSSLNRLELQALALAADPEAIGNYTHYQRLSSDGREVWLDDAAHRPGYITLMLKREEALDSVGYFDSVRAAADSEYVDRIAVATGRPVRLLPVVSYYALQAEDSLTTAGATAFSVDAQGRTMMPAVRTQYSDAAKRWHEEIFEGESLPFLPFPLGKRPFPAPLSLRTRS